ncbi:hypothetical protein M501DRAFT_930590 [Patellaria atrata CBS 101060]|uniref:dihydroneopterin aldolase n=1 Tax=Patellaria atrata CBS 101060 TaxID=1346257 RepID=A0A9P4SEN7_9PEZI|nr:hypothetical protein M501DRAFT_930590 [Patellaria atrata CBS 101060]
MSDPQRSLSKNEWDCKQPLASNKILIRNLSLSINAGLDAWGRKVPQPVSVSLTIHLTRAFESAAENDNLDQSTINYSQLSQELILKLREYESWLSTGELFTAIQSTALSIADGGSVPIRAIEIELGYPKASLLGESATVSYALDTVANHQSCGMSVSNLRLPCVIGLFAHERERKQIVVANVWIDGIHWKAVEEYGRLESVVTNVIDGSHFKTLETLASQVLFRISEDFMKKLGLAAFVRLRLEKPTAVPSAVAPAIEIYRLIPEQETTDN